MLVDVTHIARSHAWMVFAAVPDYVFVIPAMWKIAQLKAANFAFPNLEQKITF